MTPFAVAVARARTSARRVRQNAARLLEERSPDQESMQSMLEAATCIEGLLHMLESQDAAFLVKELYSGEG